MTNLSTIPATFQMASSETLPLAFDTTPLLVALETPSNAACTLTDLASGAAYSAGLSGAASINSKLITQTVTALRPDHRYRLAVSFQAAAGKVWTLELEIRCVF